MIYLVTGAAGFIGSNYVKYILKQYEDISVIIVDALTYAGNLLTLEQELADPRVHFIKGDIGDRALIETVFQQYAVDYVVNFAAESHVDRSITHPDIFLKTNVLGTQVLLETAKRAWQIGRDEQGYPYYQQGKKFLQVSTDEVYGSLKKEYEEAVPLHLDEEIKKVIFKRTTMPQTYGQSFFTEKTPLAPRSPYSASKASADFLVEAYAETYHFPMNITRCSNNYGPYHFPEKLIPLMINNLLTGKKLPVYGKGDNVRDWLYVEDHCKGIEAVLTRGRLGEVYNIGGFNEATNIEMVKLIIETVRRFISEKKNHISFKIDSESISESCIEYVQDRLGHDARYAIDPSKIVVELGWYPETSFQEGIEKTIKWYLENPQWIEAVTSGSYQEYYEKYYQ